MSSTPVCHRAPRGGQARPGRLTVPPRAGFGGAQYPRGRQRPVREHRPGSWCLGWFARAHSALQEWQEWHYGTGHFEQVFEYTE